MKTKTISIRPYQINVLQDGKRIELDQQTLISIFQRIKEKPLVLDENSRYLDPTTNNEKCFYFKQELENKDFDLTKMKFISGIFIHRRGKDIPYEENGNGSIKQITLENDDSQIAEVSYILIDVEKKILFFNYNRLVGSIDSFLTYLKILSVTGLNLTADIIFDYKQTNKSFFDTAQIQTLEFNISSHLDFFSQLGLTNEDSFRPVKKVKELAANICADSIKINLKRKRGFFLNSKNIYKMFLGIKDMKQDSSFQITTRVNEEIKILDLLKGDIKYEYTHTYEDYPEILGILTKLEIFVLSKKQELCQILG